jgi:hypothetical protein
MIRTWVTPNVFFEPPYDLLRRRSPRVELPLFMVGNISLPHIGEDNVIDCG